MRVRRVKPWWASRIIWINAATGAVGFAASMAPAVQAMMEPKHWILLFSAVNGVSVALRFVTSDPLIVRRVRADEPDVGGSA